MFYISDIYTEAPAEFKTPLQKETYKYLEKLNISYERVDTDEAITMEDCVLIITTGEKPFKAKEFGSAVKCSRVSFAPEELMDEMLGTKIGAATVFSTITDLDRDLQVIIDKEVADEEYYGCSDGTTTCYMKIKTDDIINKFLPDVKHKAKVIDI